MREKAAMRAFGCSRWTNGPAVDARGGDSDEEETVEPRITRREGSVAGCFFEVHARSLARRHVAVSPFSDMGFEIRRKF
jgi:hypothetical protein